MSCDCNLSAKVSHSLVKLHVSCTVYSRDYRNLKLFIVNNSDFLFYQTGIFHPLTKLTSKWQNCRDGVMLNKNVQPVFHNGCVYAGGYSMSYSKSVVWKYLTSGKSWSPVPTPPGLEVRSYVLANYKDQLIWIGGEKEVSPNRRVRSKDVFEFVENSWKKLDTISPLPQEIGSDVSASGHAKYLAIAWYESSNIKLLIFDDKEWMVFEGQLQKDGYGYVEVAIMYDTIYLLEHSNCSILYSASLKSLIKSGLKSFSQLSNLLCPVSNLTFFGDILTVVTENPRGVLAVFRGSRTWIPLCNKLCYGANTIFKVEVPHIIYLPSESLLLLMGSIKVDPPESNKLFRHPHPKFDVMEVSAGLC